MVQVSDPKGYYTILNVPPSATAEEIRVAFRDAAKKYHPDQGGVDDGQRFRQLTEAYETLRDGRRRMHYDALRGPSGASTGASKSDGPFAGNRGAGTASFQSNELQSGSKRWFWPTIACGLALALLASIGLMWGQIEQLGEQERLLADAYSRMDAAVQAQAEIRARYRASGFMRLEDALAAPAPQSGLPAYVFQSELAFSANELDLNAKIQAKVDQAILALADNIAQIPSDRDWLILLEGSAGQAAASDGVAVSAWEHALIRLGSVTDYLTGQGLPPERIAVRFQAGFQPVGDRTAQAGTVEIKLLCCFR